MDFTAHWMRLFREGGLIKKKQLSARTVERTKNMVSSAYTWACKQGFLRDNEVRYSESPAVAKRRAVTVEAHDLERALAMAQTFWCERTLLEAAIALGSRRGELLALRWSDQREERFEISRSLSQVDDEQTGKRTREFKCTKGKEIHFVTVPPSLFPVLEQHRAKQNEFKRLFGPDYKDQDLIFCQENGEALWPNTVSCTVSRLFRRLKCPKGTTLHSLRHTHASILFSKHQSTTAVSARLGHSNVRTTLDIYAHAIRGEDDKAAAAYDEYREKQQGASHARAQ